MAAPDEPTSSPPTEEPLPPVLYQIPAGLSKLELQGVLERELAKRLPPDEAKQQARTAFSARVRIERRTTETRYHQGPLPPADVAEAFERNAPGSIDRMFRMAEKDQDAVIVVRKDIVRRDDRFRILALAGGVVALIGICVAVIVLALQQHDGVAAALASIGLAGVIGAIVNARLSSSKSKTGLELSDEDDNEDTDP